MISTSGHLIPKFPEVRFHRTRIFNLSGQIKMNETLDEYYDLIEVYRRMDGYDREMVWSIMQTVGKTAEKRKQGVGNDKSSDL